MLNTARHQSNLASIALSSDEEWHQQQPSKHSQRLDLGHEMKGRVGKRDGDYHLHWRFPTAVRAAGDVIFGPNALIESTSGGDRATKKICSLR